MERKLYIVDVFAEEKYSGNQLAVITGAKGLSTEEMQKIAQEMNYSETTFITGGDESSVEYAVRIFTPVEEIPFAGHPTLGTAYVILKEVLQKNVFLITLNMKVGKIPVLIDYKGDEPDLIWMEQPSPFFGKKVNPDQMARSLDLPQGAIHSLFPVEEVSTGFPFIVVPLKSLKYVQEAKIIQKRFEEVVSEYTAKAVLIFASETYSPKNQLNVRVFCPLHGIPEDPATGSANGCLAAYLVKHGFFESDEIDIRVEQGYEIGRKSLIYLRSQNNQGNIVVNVGGKVVMIARGELV